MVGAFGGCPNVAEAVDKKGGRLTPLLRETQPWSLFSSGLCRADLTFI